MAELTWSPRAIADLEEICGYIAKESEHYAALFAQRVLALAETIAEFPLAGRVIPEYQSNHLRERIFQNYRIVYRVKGDVLKLSR